MKYKAFIEEWFLIDDAQTGGLVPFTLNRVQLKYYKELIDTYDIERRGLTNPVRDIILKARREGFSSLILALFAADDILQENPTQSAAISYKDDATKEFRRKYERFVMAYFQQRWGVKDAAQIFSVKSAGEFILAHNGARFYCGTASSKVAERGGVLQKLLFSEVAHYPDTDIITAKEIVEGTMRQIDIHSGWVFEESTANGYGNYYEQTWALAKSGNSRFRPVFYGWREAYTEEEYGLIKSEFTDKMLLKQEYPETPEEAFVHSGSPYFDTAKIYEYLKHTEEPTKADISILEGLPVIEETANGELSIWEKPRLGASYVLGGDTAEGLENGDWSVAKVIDNRTLKTVASLRTHASPDKFEKMVFALGLWYNEAYVAVESNKDGLWVNTELFNEGYPNLYYREELDDITRATKRKVGFGTSEKTRPVILSELRKTLNMFTDCWNDKGLLEECLVFVRGQGGRGQAMSGKHDDQIIALAIALEVRRNAPETFQSEPDMTPEHERIKRRLDSKYRKQDFVTQKDYI